MLKDYQMEPMTKELLHADFIAVRENEQVKVKIPLVLVGKSIGVLEGGILSQMRRELEVWALPGRDPAQHRGRRDPAEDRDRAPHQRHQAARGHHREGRHQLHHRRRHGAGSREGGRAGGCGAGRGACGGCSCGGRCGSCGRCSCGGGRQEGRGRQACGQEVSGPLRRFRFMTPRRVSRRGVVLCRSAHEDPLRTGQPRSPVRAEPAQHRLHGARGAGLALEALVQQPQVRRRAGPGRLRRARSCCCSSRRPS